MKTETKSQSVATPAVASGELLGQFLSDAKNKRELASKLVKCASQIEYAIGAGKVWKQVTHVKLTLNRTYIVRRIWADGNRGNLAAATWDENGWNTIHGHFYPTTGTAWVDVWV